MTDIIISVAPEGASCPALQFIDANLQFLPSLRSVIYFSSTGVCGDHGGNWIDETTPPTSTLTRGRNRISVETAWLAWSERTSLPVTILRLSGIYGPGRSALTTLQKQGKDAVRVQKPGHVFNRIHVSDIARITCSILKRTSIGEQMPHRLYNLADDEPAPPEDVVAFAAHLLNRPAPPLVPFDQADLSPMARSFYAENKKIRNLRIKDALGLELKFPNYRDGLKALYQDMA